MRYLVIFLILLLLLAGAGYLIYSFVNTTFNPQASVTPTISASIKPTTSVSAAASAIPSATTTSGTGSGSNQMISDASDFQAGVVAVGRTKTIKLFAIPSGVSQKLNLRLRGVNLEILSYTAPDSTKWTVTRSTDCDSFPALTYVCQDLQKKSGNINYGESIGEVKVRFSGLGEAYLEFMQGNGYFVNNVLQEKLGRVSSFTVVNASDLPSTAIINDQVDQLLLAAGLFLLTFVAVKLGYMKRFAYWLTSGIGSDFSQGRDDQLNLFASVKEQLAIRRLKANAKRNLEKLADEE